MATAITKTTATAIIPAPRLAEAKALCERLVSTPKLTAKDAERLRTAVARLTVPVDEEWLAGRIATLLSHYFIEDRSEGLARAVADDWIAAVMGDPCPPAWAINAGCIAYIGGPNARRRPMPGEIRDLAFGQMPWLIKAQFRLKIHDDPERWAWHQMAKDFALMSPDPEPTPEHRAKVSALLEEVVRNLQRMND
jgi:hypothetical protein